MSFRGLAVFDLDGTLLRNGTCCEVLARHLGYESRMAEFEALSDREGIERARHEMAGWYAGRSIEELTAMLSTATLAPGAEEGIALLRENGFLIGIASVTWGFAVERFARGLGIDHWLGTRIGGGGTILHVWPADKPRWAEGLRREHDIPRGMVAAVGDSSGDLPMLRGVAHPFFVGSVMPDDLSGAEHWPNGDIMEIADRILRRCDPLFHASPAGDGVTDAMTPT